MAPANPATRNIPSEDELDNILNGIIDGKDIFDTSDIQTQLEPQNQQTSATNAGLGIDEEIKVVKKRQPIPKLDENRLLSAAGVPKLRRISKERLRFKGKGHEYGDIARMLNMYQLWLDDLYPRAKFADGLAMIEKLGHSKRIQYMRKEWIDEGKPKHTPEPDDEDSDAAALDKTNEQGAERMDGLESSENASKANEPQREEQDETPHQMEVRVSADDDPDEDELDALLAESTAPSTSLMSAVLPPKIATTEEDHLFEDDMEAMAEMDMW